MTDALLLQDVSAAWWLAALAVAGASALQTATGAGLGLIAAPALLLAMQSTQAVHVAVILNLALSLLLLPSERRELPVAPLIRITVAATVGIPAGAWLLRQFDPVTLGLVAGIVVLLGAANLLVHLGASRRPGSPHTLTVAGLVAGLMTAALAIPGPAALWGLSRHGLNAAEVRAVLRAFFVLAYGFSLAVSAALGINWTSVLQASAVMLPALLTGAVAGIWLKRHASDSALRASFIALLLATGVALIANSVFAA